MIRVPKIYAFHRQKAIQKKSCMDCKYFFEGQCTAFASQEPVTGSVTFFDAIDMRLDESKCGMDAKWFTEKMCPKKS